VPVCDLGASTGAGGSPASTSAGMYDRACTRPHCHAVSSMHMCGVASRSSSRAPARVGSYTCRSSIDLLACQRSISCHAVVEYLEQQRAHLFDANVKLEADWQAPGW